MARERGNQKSERVIELHLKGLSSDIIAARVGLTAKHVSEVVSKYKKKQESNDVEAQRTK